MATLKPLLVTTRCELSEQRILHNLGVLAYGTAAVVEPPQ